MTPTERAENLWASLCNPDLYYEEIVEKIRQEFENQIEDCAKIAARFTHPEYADPKYKVFGVAVDITEKIRALKQ